MIKNIKKDECYKIIDENYVGHLGYLSGITPFVIPITYYLNTDDKSIICYSEKGHKIDAMRNNKIVTLEIENIKSVNNWKTVLIQGQYEELDGSTAKYHLHKFSKGIKARVLKEEKISIESINQFSSKINKGKSIPVVFRINIEDISGKQRE
jgi:nitroimidazol reductase NimA-like FMN-containing flavoprotein (pyridoxamine 5'-phosphate oxidase superfamily)